LLLIVRGPVERRLDRGEASATGIGRAAVTLEQLHVFVAVAERLHFTRAAQALGLTQSAVSAAVHALETRIGMPLFNRIGRHIELTEAGRLFLPEAKAVLNRVGQAEQALAELAGLERGALRLYASQTVGSYWLPRLLHRFAERHPKIALSLAIGNTREVARAVIDGSADLGFVEGDVEDPLLAPIPIGGDRLVLVVGARHPLASRRSLDPEHLMRLRWVLRERGSGTRQVFEAALQERYGFDPAALEIAWTLPSNEAVRAAVEAGAGATVISSLVAAAGLAAGRLVELPLKFPERRFTALRHGDRRRSHAESAFLASIKSAPPAE
jgi:DNA-binding transcriptional LysR family regulator